MGFISHNIFSLAAKSVVRPWNSGCVHWLHSVQRQHQLVLHCKVRKRKQCTGLVVMMTKLRSVEVFLHRHVWTVIQGFNFNAWRLFKFHFYRVFYIKYLNPYFRYFSSIDSSVLISNTLSGIISWESGFLSRLRFSALPTTTMNGVFQEFNNTLKRYLIVCDLSNWGINSVLFRYTVHDMGNVGICGEAVPLFMEFLILIISSAEPYKTVFY